MGQRNAIMEKIVCVVLWLSLVVGGCGRPARPIVSLHEAAKNGNIKQIRAHLFWTSDINVLVNNDEIDEMCTPLFIATYYGQKEVVKLLLTGGADVDACNKPSDFRPLHAAVIKGQKEIVKMLLSKNANVNARGGHASTPLHVAAIVGQEDIIKLLIGKGADINSVDGDYRSPLDYAAEHDHIEIVKKLLDYGAQVNFFRFHDRLGDISPEIADLLRKHDPNLKTKWQEKDIYAIASEGDLNKLKTLLRGNRSLANKRDDKGRTLLHVAAAAFQVDVVKYLLEEVEADAKTKDKDGFTPLHAVAEACNNSDYKAKAYTSGADFDEDAIATVSLLTIYGEVDPKDNDGRTPLEMIILSRWGALANCRLIEFLLQGGANVKVVDINAILSLYGSDMTAIAKKQWAFLVRALIKYGVEIDRDKLQGQNKTVRDFVEKCLIEFAGTK